MADRTDPRLFRLAESISDRSSVPWHELRSPTGELAPVVEGLRRVQALAEAFSVSQAGTDPKRPADRWGHLEILEPLGEGAFGEVFRARDPNLDREVALKLRRAGPGETGRDGQQLLEEARRLARIRHPNVVNIHGADLYNGRVGIWTELVDGRTLEDRLVSDGPLGPAEAVAIGLDLCRALAAIHAAGMVHGDIKAANVIRERGGRIVLTDLGSATDEGATPVTGSPATLAPEVLNGDPATAAADVFSLGLLLVRLLTGGDPSAARAVTLRDLRPDVSAELVRELERATDPEPARRHPSAGAFAHELEHVSARVEIVGRERFRAKIRLDKRAVVAAAATAAVASAALGLWLGRWAPDEGDDSSAVARAAASGVHETGGDPSVPIAVEAPVAAELRPVEAAFAAALEADASMLRAGEGAHQVLTDGDRVRPGDRLALEIETSERAHVFVVNEDLRGDVFLLFPIAGLDLGNPLPGGRRHQLPGRLDGVPQHWQVTSTGGRERFLVIASSRALPELEREIAELAAASSSFGGVNRGVGALEPAPLAGQGRLGVLVERLATEHRDDGSLWIKRFELENP